MHSSRNNPLAYGRYLSEFGQKVLGNLIENLEERKKCNKNALASQNRYRNAQNKRVLTFNDSRTNHSTQNFCGVNVISTDSQNIIHNDNNTFLNLYNTNVNMPTIPTSDKLLKTMDVDITSEKLVANESNKCIENIKYKPNHIIDENTFENIQMEEGIEWDDIIDIQLLQDLNILDTSSNINTNKTGNEMLRTESSIVPKTLDIIKSVQPDFKEVIPKVNDNISTSVSNVQAQDSVEQDTALVSTIKTHEAAGNVNIGGVAVKQKRRNSTHITDTIPKKIKKLQTPKNTTRKQKYTKAVKNWLDNVEPGNFEVVMEPENLLNKDKEKNALKITNESNKKDCGKIIQAQLTNKGGIMKFGKPKKTTESMEQQKNEMKQQNIENIISNKSTIYSGSKDKKAKPKFVAPIKSQIPVKDINYVVHKITDDNFKDFDEELGVIKDKQIHVVLTFSNGFCQLNRHYTEETYLVEGVMFQYNNVIYYWNGDYKNFWSTVKNVIEHNDIICYDGKNLLKYFASQHDMDLLNTTVNIFDTQIGGCLIDPDNPPENFTQLQKLMSFEPDYTIATECVLQKCAWYLTMLGECFDKLKTLLIDTELWKVFLDIEMRVLPIIAEMEHQGVRVDSERLKRMESALVTRMKATELACHRAAGRSFQVNSTLQVRNILYNELKLDEKSNVKIRETLCKGEKSTSETMLRSLISVHPLPKLILEFRHLHKAHATFLAGIANQVKDGIIKPTWVQTAAATGRIASNNPNIQAIPKAPFSLVLFPNNDGEEDLAESNQVLNFRSVYIAREGYMMLAADFKHIECRVFAYAAADTSLLDALTSPDLFRVLAARWLKKPSEAVSSEDRERTKRIVYASLYGAGTRKLMDILDLGYDQALSIITSFNRTFPSLKSFGRAVVARCEQNGGRLTTLCGRGRTFKNITSADFALKSHAERQAINFIVQGTAADLCKRAMAETSRRLRDAAVCARLLLQIHDELVWEVDPTHLHTAAGIIKCAMESIGHACGMATSLPVAISAGPNWGEMEDYVCL